MNKALVIARLREHEPELKAAGIARLFLFGSVARGDGGNDVDLMAEFDESRRLTLFDKAGLEVRLAEILDVPVDLCGAPDVERAGQGKSRARGRACLFVILSIPCATFLTPSA